MLHGEHKQQVVADVPGGQEVFLDVLVSGGPHRVSELGIAEQLDCTVGRALRRVHEKTGYAVEELQPDAADRAADAAANAARNVVTDGDATGAGAAETAASAAQDAAAATEQAASAAVAAARIEAALTPAGFDADRVAQIIDQAQIPQIQKETLKNLVTSAGQDPALLREALDQVKAVMQ
ncbi:hypothetical protein [Paracoccus sp. UBA5162]|uniref:hypothetical protein n=1 Tax=Paracoccus sp. UBA5162 TaxID=1947054 RepID=UPI0025F0FF1F|nr:hypothetical protein [Paracoccus sp. UBA5162]